MQQRELQECDRHDCIRPLHGLKRARWHSSDSSRQNLEMVGENIYFYGFHISFNMQQTKSAQLLQQFRSANAHESTKICSLSSEPTLNTNLSFKRRRFHCNSKVRNSQKSCLSAKACSLDVSNGQPQAQPFPSVDYFCTTGFALCPLLFMIRCHFSFANVLEAHVSMAAYMFQHDLGNGKLRLFFFPGHLCEKCMRVVLNNLDKNKLSILIQFNLEIFQSSTLNVEPSGL